MEVNSFTHKKTLVTFILSIFVFFIHFRCFSVFSDSSVLEHIFGILYPATRVAVPLFFLISALLFYRNYTFKSTLHKWKSRFFSLCIPYLVWNSFWLILGLLGNYTPLGAVTGGVKVSLTLKNVFQGIFLYAQYEPFWFLLQLTALTILCPVIYLFLKNKWIGLLTIIVYYCLYCLGVRLPEIPFRNSDMMVFYLVGAWIGIHHRDLLTIKVSHKHAVVSLWMYIFCCICIGLIPYCPTWFPSSQFFVFIRLISCFSFWFLFDLFDIGPGKPFLKESFAIYAMHSFVGASLSKILSLLLPNTEPFIILIAALSFPATIVIICAFALFLKKYLPGFKTILFGH